MSVIGDDLEQFLEVVAKVSSSVADGSGSIADHWPAIESAGLPDLAQDTSDEPDALQWLTHTVRVAAETSPSLAYVLAARYVAHLALGDTNPGQSTFALLSADVAAVVPGVPAADVVVGVDLDESHVVTIPWSDVATTATTEARSGLAAAGLTSFEVPAEMASLDSSAARILSAWDLLLGAALVGVAERAVRGTQEYVLQRRQFGVPIGSFAGLRALVAEMQLRVEPLRALLDLASTGHAPSDSAAALAGRAAVANCIDAIQAHGGYGYIVEYPFADLLRDAMSLQARAGGRRLHLARVALRGLGAPEGRP